MLLSLVLLDVIKMISVIIVPYDISQFKRSIALNTHYKKRDRGRNENELLIASIFSTVKCVQCVSGNKNQTTEGVERVDSSKLQKYKKNIYVFS